MSLVLAVEPDDTQVKILRGLVGGPNTELVVVVSPKAALDAIDRRMPDLVLLSESLGSKKQPVLDKLRSLPAARNVKTLPIPDFKTADHESFAAEVTLSLLPATKPKTQEGKPGAIAPEVHEAHIALLQADMEARLASELERVRREAAEQRAAEMARLEAASEEKRRAEVAAARAAATDEARHALTSELAGIRGEAEDMLAAELARVRNEAAQKLAAQLAEADMQRSAAVEEARLAAEQAAREALEAEAARMHAEADARLQDELARVHAEAEQAKATAQQTKQEAEAALAAEVARVRQESEAQLAAELARARAEADEALNSQQARHVDLEAIRDAAAAEARAAAEVAARGALEAEAERVRAEAEARLQEELARVRADAERVRQEQEQIHFQAEVEREERTRETREAVLREAREAATREARAAAEATAIRRADAEVARVRAEAEIRLRAELEKRQALERRHEQAELVRAADQSQLEQVRQDVEREARRRADEVLRAEIARARAEAEARLAAEVAEVEADAERRRNAELAEIRNQLAHANAMAREHARVAAKGAVSAEVARAEIEMPGASARAASIGSQAALTTLRAAGIAARGIGRGAEAAGSAIGWIWRHVPTNVGVAIIGLAAAAAAFVILDVRSFASSGIEYVAALVSDLRGAASRVAVGAQTPDSTPVQGGGPGIDAAIPAEPAVPQTPGTLAVFSRVPLDLYIGGRRIGSTEDGQIILPPATYRVELVSERLNYRGSVQLNIRPAAVTSHTVTLPNGRLQVNTEPGAQVSVEGKPMGVAPLGPLPVQIGTREVVVTHPDLGERREFIEVRFGDVTQLTIARRAVTDPAKLYPLPNLSQPSAPIR